MRDDLVQDKWMPMVQELEIPFSDDFDFQDFMADPAEVRTWNLQVSANGTLHPVELHDVGSTD